MATSFPTSLDTYTVLVDNTDPIAAAHPNNRGDAIEALESKVGINSSAVGTSHDYLLEHLPTQAANWDAGPYEVRAETFESDVATGDAPFTVASTTVVTNLNANTVNGKSAPSGTIVGTTDSQTLTNKTLTSPVVNTGDINTPDIDGGTLDGITIGASSAPTVTDLGSVATCDINGGTVNGITSLGLSTGTDITEISIDDTMTGDSDNAVPTEQAVKDYVDNNKTVIGDMPTGIESAETALTASNSYGPTAAGAYWYMSMGKNSSGEFVMASGEEDSGTVIPLPTDCAEADCHWIVSVKWAQSAGFAWTGFTTSINASRECIIRNEGYNWVS